MVDAESMKAMPNQELADVMRTHFQECIGEIRDKLRGIDILKENPLSLNVALSGSEAEMKNLKQAVENENIGVLHMSICISPTTTEHSNID